MHPRRAETAGPADPKRADGGWANAPRTIRRPWGGGPMHQSRGRSGRTPKANRGRSGRGGIHPKRPGANPGGPVDHAETQPEDGRGHEPTHRKKKRAEGRSRDRYTQGAPRTDRARPTDHAKKKETVRGTTQCTRAERCPGRVTYILQQNDMRIRSPSRRGSLRSAYQPTADLTQWFCCFGLELSRSTAIPGIQQLWAPSGRPLGRAPG